MKQLLSLILLIGLGQTAIASSPAKIKCETPREHLIVQINDNSVAIEGRAPAQAVIQRTKRIGNSLEKIFYLSGQKHTVHIGDINGFSDSNDYVSIESREGHEVTFPLSCALI